MAKKFNLVGQTFGRLTVIMATDQRKNGYVLWLCKCECQNEVLVRTGDLTSFNTQSCGCYKRERTCEAHTIHGESGSNRTLLYRVWSSMLNRCSDKTQKNYGGRGIKVCEEWRAFIAFRDWALEHGYRKGLEIDRIDNDGDYCPENCRWVTHSDNQRNTRRTRWETINDKTKSLAEWCEINSMSYEVVYQRLVRGWNVVDALTTPVRNNGKGKPKKP